MYEDYQRITLVDFTAGLIAAYVSHNSVQRDDLPALIVSVHAAMTGLGAEPVNVEAEKPTPPVSIKKSITSEHLISMEDGRQYKSLKRHLTGRGLTPAQYREKWGLPRDYPMVAPGYSARRSELAKASGLGNQRKAAPEPMQVPEAVVLPTKKTRGRTKKETAVSQAAQTDGTSQSKA